MLDTFVPHIEDEHLCYGCGRDQSQLTDWYRSCGECGHKFETESELLRMDREWWEGYDIPSPEPRSGAEVYTCPCCTHDF